MYMLNEIVLKSWNIEVIYLYMMHKHSPYVYVCVFFLFISFLSHERTLNHLTVFSEKKTRNMVKVTYSHFDDGLLFSIIESFSSKHYNILFTHIFFPFFGYNAVYLIYGKNL